MQIHHIDGNPSNYAARNLAVLCLDCHSRVTGDEGFGRRYSPQEVARYKREWELLCADSNRDAYDDRPDELIQVLQRTVLLRSGEHLNYELELERDDELVVSVSADDYIDTSLCSERQYERWVNSGAELLEYDGEEDVRKCLLTFVAQFSGNYVILVINENDADVEVTVNAAVWGDANDT